MSIKFASSTEEANQMIRNGWAEPGDLVMSRGKGQLFKVTDVKQVNYGVLDEDGREWKIKFASCKAAPVGAVFSGPDRPSRVEQAKEFSVLDEVEMIRDRDRAKFPGTYVIVKRTSPGRFKLQRKGGMEWETLTGPAGLIRKVEAEQ